MITGEPHGIRLCYGRATGYGTYGREGMLRGARVIRLHEGQRQFDTWITLSDGSQIREQEKHEPETSPLIYDNIKHTSYEMYGKDPDVSWEVCLVCVIILIRS